MRTRLAQKADEAAISALVAHGVHFERLDAPLRRLFEIRGRIVGASAGRLDQIAAPTFLPEPLAELPAVTSPGDELALIGAGLVVVPDVGAETLVQIHRLARTLRSQEDGARWCVAIAPIPRIRGYDAAGAVQQIVAGSLEYPPISVPLREGYFPVGLVDHECVVMTLRNQAF